MKASRHRDFDGPGVAAGARKRIGDGAHFRNANGGGDRGAVAGRKDYTLGVIRHRPPAGLTAGPSPLALAPELVAGSGLAWPLRHPQGL